MKKFYTLQAIFMALITLFCINPVHAELILSENFDYDLGIKHLHKTTNSGFRIAAPLLISKS